MQSNSFEADFHFIAIGGVGQSALAKILLCLGYKVSGSDINESKYTKLVKELGAKVFIGHSKDNISGTPKVVVSSAIKEDNPEIIKAKELNLEILHRSDCLKLISQKFPCFIGFSGTHGKTTTSGLMSFVLESLKENPSYAIGGIIPKINQNAAAHLNSKYFIAELDESDGSIQKYSPNYLIINNLEADHLDFYKNGISDIIPVFKKVISNMDNVKGEKKIFINIDNENCAELNKELKGDVVTYAIEKKADYIAKNIKQIDLTTTFDVYKKDEFLANFKLIIPGVYNVYNALAVISVLDGLGFKACDYSTSISEFSGMGRRFQLVAQINNIKIIDDYAHHPSEIKSTLSALNEIKRRKVAIFQPHRYTRLKGLWNDFLDSFNNIDELFVLDTFSAGDKFDETFNSKTFVDEITKKGVKAQYIDGTITQASEKIAPKLKENDVVLTLGAGDITKIGGLINDLLAK